MRTGQISLLVLLLEFVGCENALLPSLMSFASHALCSLVYVSVLSFVRFLFMFEFTHPQTPCTRIAWIYIDSHTFWLSVSLVCILELIIHLTCLRSNLSDTHMYTHIVSLRHIVIKQSTHTFCYNTLIHSCLHNPCTTVPLPHFMSGSHKLPSSILSDHKHTEDRLSRWVNVGQLSNITKRDNSGVLITIRAYSAFSFCV